MAMSWRVGRHILVASSFCAGGLSQSIGAEEPKDAGAIPPIFSRPVAERAATSSEADTLAAPTPRRESTLPMLDLISEGLPKFNPKVADNDADQPGSLSSLGQSVPVLMDPFTVFDARVLELEKPHENLLERIDGTEPVYRHVGDRLTSELTFVDLAKASNWRPFSMEPSAARPAVSLRFTVSW
jgi:hypothetical protein